MESVESVVKTSRAVSVGMGHCTVLTGKGRGEAKAKAGGMRTNKTGRYGGDVCKAGRHSSESYREVMLTSQGDHVQIRRCLQGKAALGRRTRADTAMVAKKAD